MTTATIALSELAEKGADIDVLRQMVQFMAQRLMELDIEGRCGASSNDVLAFITFPQPVARESLIYERRRSERWAFDAKRMSKWILDARERSL